MRAEGYEVDLGDWPFVFVVHHADRGGEPCEGRWIVSEAVSGFALTDEDYVTDDAAIRAARAWLNAGKRWQRIWAIEKAIKLKVGK